ncbi:MAG: PAS domain S-box protein [Methanolinea sp.]|nr:PAS domain S-box protein [Methanolinea sp.]
MERKGSGGAGEGLPEARERNLEPGDHVAVLLGDPSGIAPVTESILGRCGEKGWYPIYISRFPERNPAIFAGDSVRAEIAGRACVLSHGDPLFHSQLATVEAARAFFGQKAREAAAAGYSAVCIVREVPPLATHKSERSLVSDLADLKPLFDEGSLVLVCIYRMGETPAATLLNVLRTHPLVVLDGRIIRNFFYIPASDAQRYNLPSLELQHWLDTLREISRQTEILRESEARYRDLLENASDLVQSVDANGRFLFVNRTWRERLGYTREDLERITLFDVVAPESLSHCRELFARVTSGEDVGTFEAVFRAKSGERVYVEGRANCLMVGGKPRYTRGIFRDITARKKGRDAGP